MRKEVQKQVLEHLQTKGNISQLEALKLYQCMRLAAVIIRLRKRFEIKTVMETNPATGSQYARYYYKGVKEA